MSEVSKKFIPSPQQQTLFDWVKSGKGNSFVQAVAGSGKTTSLLEALPFMEGDITLVSFGNKIAAEISGKLQERKITNAQAKTFHSIGLATYRFTQKYVKVEGKKTYKVMEEIQVPDGYTSFVVKMVSLAKNAAIGHFGDVSDKQAWSTLCDRHNVEMELDKDHNVDEGIQWAIKVLVKSNTMRQIIDFDDMIYLPVLLGIKPHQSDWVLVDEAQDTNPARRELAKAMIKPSGRMIWVGDKHQAIFGFTGADADSVDIIVKEFKCAELPLTVTYRCPKAVVKASQAYVAHIQAHESAPEGSVANLTAEAFGRLHTGLNANDAILCRKTSPIVSLAYKLIRKGVPCAVEGKDISSNLVALLTKWKIKTVDKYLNKLDDWASVQIKRAETKKNEMQADSIRDRVETIKIICEGCELLTDAVAKVKALFTETTEGEKAKTLILSTVHKAKGREWDRVFVLGFAKYMPHPMAKQVWQKEQEANLIYVAFTRAKRELFLVED